jgi:hypothetical protein
VALLVKSFVNTKCIASYIKPRPPINHQRGSKEANGKDGSILKYEKLIYFSPCFTS